MASFLHTDGWSTYNIWDHSASVATLYRLRARDEVEEMTCAGQAAEMLAAIAIEGESLLDVGCGTGYFMHSLRRRDVPLAYYGIDATEAFIDTGRNELAAFGLDPARLSTLRIEDVRGRFDHVLCMNVLSNIDNFHRPLDRIFRIARKTVILRESIKDGAEYRFVRDDFLDEGVDLNVHVNAYDRTDIAEMAARHGFRIREVVDRRTGGRPEMVIGYPHYWTFIVATRDDAAGEQQCPA